MRRLIKRASAAAIVGLGATLLPILAPAPAGAAPGPQPTPTITPDPVPTASSDFTFSTGTCDGTGGAGWRVQTFIVNGGVDVGTLVFDQGSTFDRVGNDRDNSDGTIASPLWKDNAPGTGYNPAASPAGLINPADLTAFDFGNAGWVLTDGAYQVGYACIDPLGATAQWWAQTVTIDATPGGGSSFMVTGSAAPAPAIDVVNVDNGQVIIEFTGTDADSFTAQASTTSGDFSSPVGTSTTVADDTSNITISGLTNGTSYYVRVLAEKAGFAPVPSAQSGPHVPETNGGAVQNLTVTSSGTDDAGSGPYVDVDWSAPAPVGGCTVTGYDVAASPSGSAVQPAPGGDATSARITGVPTNQQLTVTVTPTFAAGCVGTAANVPAFVATGNVVIQDIDVTRPIGALVLTQVCGANGAIPAEGGLSAIPANNSSTVGSPNLPSPSGNPRLVEDPAGPLDPAYASYPYPTDGNGVANPASETHCGLDLGVARYVTSGPGAGQYFAATAAMNQVTIVDTRNVDAGWTVTGQMSDFVATSEADDGSGPNPPLDEFSGDFLGWSPIVTGDTPAFDSDADGTADYDQLAVPGAAVAPATVGGLGDGATLAQAAAGEGLGTAILDARIRLLIPVTADAGFYEGALRFSAV